MRLPQLGDVYETSVSSMAVLACVRIKRIGDWGGFSYDFLVLDGGPPTIRTWSSRSADDYLWSSSLLEDFSLEAIMSSFKFKKIA